MRRLLNHEDARNRRKAIVSDVRKGKSDEKTAKKHGVTVQFVAMLRCRHADERPVEMKHCLKVSTFEILRLLVEGGTVSDVARKFRVSRQRVSRIAVQARKAGWHI